MTHIKLFARIVMENPITLGFMGFILIVIPILGIWSVHKYGWEHWEPFGRSHK